MTRARFRLKCFDFPLNTQDTPLLNMSNKTVDIDLVSRASETCLGGFCAKGSIIALQDLQDEPTDGQPLKRRIVAVHVGTHNGLEFRAKHIKAMVKAAQDFKKKEKLQYFKVPIVLDHSPHFLDKVGATFELNNGKHPDDGKDAAIADVDFWTNTSILKEVSERVRLDPENTFFSVRVRGKIGEDDDGDFLYDMELIHIAVVNEPADQGAKMIEELKAKKDNSDFPLNNGKGNEDSKKLEEKAMEKDEIDKITKQLQKEADEKLKAREAELKKEIETELKEKGELVALRAEVLALDKDVDTEMLESFSKDQLVRYTADLERLLTTVVQTGKSTEAQAGEQSAEDLANKYFGELDVTKGATAQEGS